MALNGVPLNGQAIDRTPNYDYDVGPQQDDVDEEMPGESSDERRTRYLNSEQGEVSDPEEWVSLHHGHWDADQHARMVDYANDNLQRLINARATLRDRYNNAAIHGNWEEAANFSRAIEEVEALMDIA